MVSCCFSKKTHGQSALASVHGGGVQDSDAGWTLGDDIVFLCCTLVDDMVFLLYFGIQHSIFCCTLATTQHFLLYFGRQHSLFCCTLTNNSIYCSTFPNDSFLLLHLRLCPLFLNCGGHSVWWQSSAGEEWGGYFHVLLLTKSSNRAFFVRWNRF